jgi:hypothetical protein
MSRRCLLLGTALTVSCALGASPERASPPSGVIRVQGAVVDDEGRPVADGEIILVWEPAAPPVQRIARTWTGDDGVYALTARLPAHVRCSGLQLTMVKAGYFPRITRKGALRCDGACRGVDFTTEPLLDLARMWPGVGVTVGRCR